MSGRKLKVRRVHLVVPTARRDGRGVDLNMHDMRIIEILSPLREKHLLTPRRNVPLKKLRRLKPLDRRRMQTNRAQAINSPTPLRR
jgi:hypothetical protein